MHLWQGRLPARQFKPTPVYQYTFSGWDDNNGLVQPSATPIQVVTANPAITSFTATVAVAYQVSLNYFTPLNSTDPTSPPTCGAPGAIPAGQSRPGVVYIGKNCYWSSVSLFVTANTLEDLNAYPYPGFAFTGWTINGAPSTSFLTTVTVNTPLVIAPIFVPAKRVSFLTIATRIASAGRSHPSAHPDCCGCAELSGQRKSACGGPAWVPGAVLW